MGRIFAVWLALSVLAPQLAPQLVSRALANPPTYVCQYCKSRLQGSPVSVEIYPTQVPLCPDCAEGHDARVALADELRSEGECWACGGDFPERPVLEIGATSNRYRYEKAPVRAIANAIPGRFCNQACVNGFLTRIREVLGEPPPPTSPPPAPKRPPTTSMGWGAVMLLVLVALAAVSSFVTRRVLAGQPAPSRGFNAFAALPPQRGGEAQEGGASGVSQTEGEASLCPSCGAPLRAQRSRCASCGERTA